MKQSKRPQPPYWLVILWVLLIAYMTSHPGPDQGIFLLIWIVVSVGIIGNYIATMRKLSEFEKMFPPFTKEEADKIFEIAHQQDEQKEARK